jgi:hypothetical protein
MTLLLLLTRLRCPSLAKLRLLVNVHKVRCKSFKWVLVETVKDDEAEAHHEAANPSVQPSDKFQNVQKKTKTDPETTPPTTTTTTTPATTTTTAKDPEKRPVSYVLSPTPEHSDATATTERRMVKPILRRSWPLLIVDSLRLVDKKSKDFQLQDIAFPFSRLRQGQEGVEG